MSRVSIIVSPFKSLQKIPVSYSETTQEENQTNEEQAHFDDDTARYRPKKAGR